MSPSILFFDFGGVIDTPKPSNPKIEREIRALIESLSNSAALYIVTSMQTSDVTNYLKTHNLLPFFRATYGIDIDVSKTNKFNLIMKKEDRLPSQCVLITDTIGDIREATACRIPSIAVLWGYHDKETLLRGNPVAIVETVDELKETIATL